MNLSNLLSGILGLAILLMVQPILFPLGLLFFILGELKTQGAA